MESNLLEKENEYRKENDKLEIKTKELMEKVNDVMKMQESLIKETFKTKEELSIVKSSTFSQDLPSSKSSISLEADLCKADERNGIPSSVSEMGTKGMINFFRSKLKVLQNEVEWLHGDNKRKTEDFRRVQKENQELNEEKEKWLNMYNTTRANVTKLESQVTTLQSKLQVKENEISILKKNSESLKKEVKQTSSNLSSIEIKLNKALDEADKSRAALKQFKEEEKEMREAHRKQIQELQGYVKQIEKHKGELIEGFKKQLQLIDNLKKQKMLLETFKLTEVSEYEFMNLLDLKLE